MTMSAQVFIHTNPKQRLGALVGAHSLMRNSRDPTRFRVRILSTEDFPFLARYQGRRYLREGRHPAWDNDDLQSFTPLRFAVPSQTGYSGRAVVMDPDIFAVGDINELLETDMGEAAVLARRMPAEGRRPLHYASSVMLLDCARLRHWELETDFEKLFTDSVDYRDWMWLLTQPRGTVGDLDPAWNDFDHLGPTTRLLHNTHRRTQPWKTGLQADFTSRGTTWRKRVMAWGRRLKGRIGGGSETGYYQPHPDPAQERLFFALLGECLESGVVTPDMLREEIARRHIRADAFERVRAAAGAGGGSHDLRPS